MAKPQLGRVGVFSFAFAVGSAAASREAVARIEELGYGAVWYPETVGGKESLSVAGLLLGWSEEIAVVPGIASIYARDPMATANGARGLSEAYPGRFVLGVGVSHAPAVAARGATYGKPVTAMREYLD